MRTLFRRQISRSTGDLNALREFAKLFCPAKADSDVLERRNCRSCILPEELVSSLPDVNLRPTTQITRNVYKEGFLHAKVSNVWLRSYVVLRMGYLEIYREDRKDQYVLSVNIIGCHVHIPTEDEGDEVMRRFYPLKLVLKNLSTFTLCARSFDERRDWTEAIRHASSEPDSTSLNIEGLNLECGQLSKETTRRPLFEKKDDALFRRRKALHDLRKETAELQDACRKQLTGHDWNQMLASIDNKYDRAFVSTQQEALRKATLLRQRKISTQLKIETIKKQLPTSGQRPAKSRPASHLPGCVEENRQEVEMQLEELTSKLQQIEGVLNDTERKAMVALQKLDIRRKEEVQNLRSDSPCGVMTNVREDKRVGNVGDESSSWTPQETEFLPRICLSMSADDCTAAGSQKSKRTFPSPRRKHFADVIKSTSSVPSLIFSSNKGIKQHHQEQSSLVKDSEMSKSSEVDPSSSGATSGAVLRSKKSRKSPLKVFGDFVDNRLLRRWRVEKRTRSADLTPPSEHHETVNDAFSRSADSDIRPRASTFTASRTRLPAMSTSSNSDPFLHCIGDNTHSGTISLESQSSGDEEAAEQRASTLAKTQAERQEEFVKFASRSNEERRLDEPEPEKPQESEPTDEKHELRTEINPDMLAEIEAFELMAQDYLRHHQREQVTT